MSEILTKSQLYSYPLDTIMEINRQWRNGIKKHDLDWISLVNRYPDSSIDQYIIERYSELKDQFNWEKMSGNDRMIMKFSHIESYQSHYDGSGYKDQYDGSNYDRGLDPFYDQP